MPSLDPDTLARLDESIEVEMRTPRADGSVSSRPVWVVVVDGDAYVRSYLGPSGAWYRRALADGRLAIGLDSETVDMKAEPAHDEELNRRVSEAFQAKYAANSPGPTEAMVSPEVVATTLRLEPVDA